MAEDEKFISRWAKRKAESRNKALVEEEAVPEADVLEETATLEDADDPDDHPAAGIDIESLDANSDFTVFMHEKVPHAVRRMALRKLWQSDPIFSTLDGLNDYDEDFTDAATVVAGLKAAYDEAVKREKAKEEAEARARQMADSDTDSETASEAGTEEEPVGEDETDDTGQRVAAADGAGETAQLEVDDDDQDVGTDEG